MAENLVYGDPDAELLYRVALTPEQHKRWREEAPKDGFKDMDELFAFAISLGVTLKPAGPQGRN